MDANERAAARARIAAAHPLWCPEFVRPLKRALDALDVAERELAQLRSCQDPLNNDDVAWCGVCGAPMRSVRPGKAECDWCERREVAEHALAKAENARLDSFLHRRDAEREAAELRAIVSFYEHLADDTEATADWEFGDVRFRELLAQKLQESAELRADLQDGMKKNERLLSQTTDAMGEAAELRAEVERLKVQLPPEMEGRRILFRECPRGHGELVGENWVERECPWC